MGESSCLLFCSTFDLYCDVYELYFLTGAEMTTREMPLLGEIKGPALLPDYLIARCSNETDSVMLCWHMRRVKYSMSEAARLLGIPAPHLSNIIAGKKYLPHNSIAFQQLCGNWAIRQYQDKSAGLRTVTETAEQRRIRELESELEAARRAA